MKVLHMLKMSGIGGVQNQFETFLKSALKTHPHIEHLVLSPGGIEDHYHESKKRGISSYFFVFFKIFLNRKEIIHSYNNLTSEKYYWIYKVLRPRKLIFHERGNCWNFQRKTELVLKNANLAKMIIANSEATKTLLVKRFGIIPEKIKVIHNGLISDFNYDLVDQPITKDKKVIGFIGRIEAIKGIQTIIDAISLLDQQDQEKIEVQVWGDGEAKAFLSSYAVEKNAPVVFMGRAKEPLRVVQGFDLMIIPSIREPFGIVAVEASIFKIPVIASEVDGLAEIIENNVSGVLIKPTLEVRDTIPSKRVPIPLSVVNPRTQELESPREIDPFILKQEILKFLEEPSIFKKYGENLHCKAKNMFHIKKFTDLVVTAYNRVSND